MLVRLFLDACKVEVTPQNVIIPFSKPSTALSDDVCVRQCYNLFLQNIFILCYGYLFIYFILIFL